MKQFLLDLTLFDNFYWKHWLFIFSIFIIIHIPAIYQASTKTNLAVHQAEAFLKGNTYVSNYYWDVAEYEGKYYVSFPPFPSIVALPFVALFEFVNSVLISLLLTCFSMYTLFQILVKILPDRRGRKWVFLSFFFGSGYWWTVLTSHHINGFAHVVCTLLLFLLLNELLNKQRPILIGLLIGAAFLSRQMTIFYGILILYYLVVNNSREKLFSSVIITGVTFAIPLGFYLYFNYLRFNSPFNTGHGYIVYQAVVNGNDLFKSRVSELGLFNWRYIPFNFYHLFIKGHNVIFGGQSMLKPQGIDLFGSSILAASPFIIFSLKAKLEKWQLMAFWSTILMITIGILMYHNNGWQQVNTQRFSLDFFPALILLVAWGYSSIPSWLFRGLVIYAIGLNCVSFGLHLYFQLNPM